MENLEWGLRMTGLGMGLVFALLALLWGLLLLVQAFDKQPAAPLSDRAATEAAERIAAIADQAVGAQTPEPPTVNGMAADLVAAILVATMKHRQTLRREAAPLMRPIQPGSKVSASRWVAAGRARQTNTWQPRGK